jgi:hypothetical protein
MDGRRSLNLELTTFDPEIEITARENLRLLRSSKFDSEKFVEIGELLGNGDPPRTLRELFAPITTNTPSCMV